MPFVNEETGNRARTGVEVLVVAPEGKIGSPVVKPMGKASGRMTAVEADGNRTLPGDSHQPLDVEKLTASIQNGRKHDEGDLVGHCFDDVVLVDRPPVAALDQHEVFRRIATTLANLTVQRVDIRRKVELVGEDARSPSFGSVECRDQAVKIDCRGSGDDDLTRIGADEAGLPSTKLFGKAKPWPIAPGPAVDCPIFPGGKRLKDRGLRVAGGEAKRVAVEVNPVDWNVEAIAKRAKGVGLVEVTGEFLTQWVDWVTPPSPYSLLRINTI